MANGTWKIYDELKHRLVAGHYQPGSQLKEEPLAEEFGISRTPVRAALRKLVEDGLATADGGRGVQVASWTQWDIEEVFQLRLLLEPYAAQLAATRSTQEVVARLESCNAQMRHAIAGQVPDLATVVQDANREFHHTLLQASGSQRLSNMLATMIDMPVITRSFQLYASSDMAQSLHHHEDLTLAVAAKDGELAKKVMELHLQMSRHRFLRIRQG